MDSTEILKKVIILGNGESRHEAPFADESYEVWVTSTVRDAPRYDRVFDIHDSFDDSVEGFARRDFIRDSKVPVMMGQHHEALPMSVPYPLEEIKDAYGNYFTNSISYMLAFAIYLDIEEILIYGVSMEHDVEYGKQRASCEFWIGLAIGKRIKVETAPSSDLCKAYYLYGYETHPMVAKAKEKNIIISKALGEIKQKYEFYKMQMHKHEGYKEGLDYFLNYFE